MGDFFGAKSDLGQLNVFQKKKIGTAQAKFAEEVQAKVKILNEEEEKAEQRRI